MQRPLFTCPSAAEAGQVLSIIAIDPGNGMLFEQQLIDELISIHQSLDADNLPEILMRAVKGLMQSERVIILLGDGARLSDGHRNLGVQYSSHPVDQLQLSRSVLEEAMASADGAWMLNEDVNRTESMSAHRIRSCAAAAVRIGRRTVGAIYCDVRQSNRRFTQEDCVHLKKIAALLAPLFENLSGRSRPDFGRCDAGTGEIAGSSRFVTELKKSIEQAAKSQQSVLITGPTGSGKELVARALHTGSRRKGKLVVLNCGETADTVVASELFGHVKGAFTDAHETRTGMIVEADRGTLFLDEIGNASLEFQAKLLRVLETREVRPIGSSVPTHKVDVRFVFATNKDLEQEIADKKFMQDLYYRIGQIRLSTIALSSRLEDIPELARDFARPLAIEQQAIDRLQAMEWPGNVRQLRGTVELARDMEGGEVVTLSGIEAAARLSGHQADRVTSMVRDVEAGRLSFYLLRAAVEERRLTRLELARVLDEIHEKEGSWANVGRKLQVKGREDLKRFDNFVQNLKRGR